MKDMSPVISSRWASPILNSTGGKDRRLFDAAVKLADCWCDHIGPAPKQAWFDGHQEIEQAMVRLGRFVNDIEGAGKGQKYIDLAKFLLDSRTGGSEYDNPCADGSAVLKRWGMRCGQPTPIPPWADIAMETNDPGYWGAALSIWDDMINRKFYLTGGIVPVKHPKDLAPIIRCPTPAPIAKPAPVAGCSTCNTR